MKNFKKVVAGLSAMTLIAMNAGFMANAATPTAVISTDDIVITDATFDAGMNISDLSVKVKDSADADIVVTPVITEDTLTLTTGGIAATVYSVNYVFNNGTTDFIGAVVVDNMADGTAGSNSVAVTAAVLPILSMAIQGENYAGSNATTTFTPTTGTDADNFTAADAVVLEKADGTIFETTVASVNAGVSVVVDDAPVSDDFTKIRLASKNDIAFGELAIGDNTESLNVRTASNAADGVTVSVASNGLRTGDTASDYVIGTKVSTDAEVITTGTDSYKITSTTTNGGVDLVEAEVSDTQDILTADNVTKSNATTTVNLKATIDGQTEAGSYGDTLTFTVTGNF